MGSFTATVARPTGTNVILRIRTFSAIVGSGFRRHATYRQAAVAGVVTNTVFGFLRCYVLLAAVGAAGTVAGYDRAQLATFVWVGQGLLAVILLWGWTELADRIRTGEIAADLLRPIHPVTSYLATDLGRAGWAAFSRLLPPVLVGPLFFDVYLPQRAATGPLFVFSVLVAVLLCFGCRYLVNATAYWLYDVRGAMILWTLCSGVLAGLYFPLRFLPDGLLRPLWLITPFPSLFQTPLDVLVERDPPATQLELVGLQVGWAVAILLLCRLVQRRAERRMVVQGG
ncbi:ABC transporter permease [Micromonospora mirobrigensis]|uniref:ABC-2 type transport system permease protein n=1 Tax=Micromonospora mirobrigensis TaxID=262898 RepID=A0A1C5A6C2_9ACTN|nr:ABC-2 family transporter protein [Micromonospora mirobrigensis]SCF40706.1 ABC-2 type transport system permease protein [Micromonospora mirobrigensis]